MNARKCFIFALIAIMLAIIGWVYPLIEFTPATYINASYINYTGFAAVSGSITDLNDINGSHMLFNESNSPFMINITFSNISSFDYIELKWRYYSTVGASTHVNDIEIWCQTEAEFVDLPPTFTNQLEWAYFTKRFPDSMHFIDSNNNVTIRINHSSNGNINHRLELDTGRLVISPQYQQINASINYTTISGTAGTMDHANLTNLNWASANHTIDTDIEMNLNSIQNASKINYKSNIFTQYTDNNIYNYMAEPITEMNYTELKQWNNSFSFFISNSAGNYHQTGFTINKFYTNKPIESEVSNGTSPFNILYSTTLNSNLNSDLLDGQHGYEKVNKSGDNMTGMLYINNQSIDKLIFHYIVPSNTSWVNVTGLNITRDGFYDITLQLTCRVATNGYVFINNDTNNSNYSRQYVLADGSSILASRDNSAGISACSQNLASTGKQRVILDSFGKTHYTSEVGLMTGTSLIFFNGDYSYNINITNVNTFNFNTDVIDGFGFGSEIWIYRS